MAERKRIVALFLAILMIMQMLPVNVLAAGIEGYSTFIGATYAGVRSTEIEFQVAQTDSTGAPVVDANGNITYKTLTTQLVIEGEPEYPDIPDVQGYKTIGWGEANGNVIKAVYEKLETITVRVDFKYTSGEQARESLIYDYEKGTGSKLTVKPDVLDGFNMAVTKNGVAVQLDGNGSFEIDVPNLTADEAYLVTYSGKVVNYTVNHHVQNTKDANYTTTTETKSGTAGTKTAAGLMSSSNNWEGFTVPTAEEIANEQRTIAPDGSTVIDFYYNRNTYNVTYVTNGGSPLLNEVLPYGYEIVLPEITRLGYTLTWKISRTDNNTELATGLKAKETYTMPAYDLTIEAVWAQPETANYTIMYWVQGIDTLGGTKNLVSQSNGSISDDDKYYEYLKSVPKSGRVGTTPNATTLQTSPNSHGLSTTFYSYNANNSEVSATIAADGSTVYHVRFDRAVIKFTFENAIFVSSSYWGNTYKDLVMYGLYGQTFAQNGLSWPSGVWSGDSNCDGNWTYLDGFNHPSLKDTEATFEKYSSGSKRVIQYIESLDSTPTNRKWIEADNMSTAPNGGFNITAKFEPAFSLYGYSKDSATKISTNIPSSSVSFDNTIRVYSTRNSFTLSYANCGTVEPTTYKFEAPLVEPTFTVTPPAGVDPEQYEFGGWYHEPAPASAQVTPVNWGTETMPAANKIVYAKWVPKVKTVTYHYNDGKTEDKVFNVYAGDTLSEHHYSEQGYVNTTSSYANRLPSNLANPFREDYVFDGWYMDEACTKPLDVSFATAQITKNYDVYAKWVSTKIGSAVGSAVVAGGSAIAGYYENGEWVSIDNIKMPTAAGRVGETVYLVAPEIPGYEPIQPIVPHVLTAGEVNTVYIPYRKLDIWNLLVRYEDLEGNEIADFYVHDQLTAVQKAVVYKKLDNGEDENGVYMWQIQEPHVQIGYKKDAKEDSNHNLVAEVIFKYEKVYQAPYKTEHYKWSYEQNNYVLADTTTGLKDWTGFTVQAEANTYANYHLVTVEDMTVSEGVVKKDGTLTLKLYYEPDTFKVTYDYEPGAPTNASPLPGEENYAYGSTVDVETDATAAGYTFTGWYTKDGAPVTVTENDKTFKMPAADVTLYGRFTRDLGSLTVKKTVEGLTLDRLQGISITVKNSAGETVATIGYEELKEDGTFTVTGLPTGTYTVTEDEASVAVVGYTLDADSSKTGEVPKNDDVTVELTNTYARSTSNITITKTWDDNNNQDGFRPAINAYTVTLSADGETAVNVTAWKEQSANVWTATATVYTHTADGAKITYAVGETFAKSDKYTQSPTTYVAADRDKLELTNAHTIEKTSVSGAKTWNDNNNQDGKRPDSITINLLANDTKVDSKTITATDNWSWSFTNLDKYAGGQVITYTVKEEGESNGQIAGKDGKIYTVTYDGMNVTNSYTPETITVSGTKTWVDQNDLFGTRPTTIYVGLFANGTKVDTATVTADERSFSFTNLPKYSNGQLITYTVGELASADATTAIAANGTLTNGTAAYTVSYNGNNITNTLQTGTLEIEKVVKDSTFTGTKTVTFTVVGPKNYGTQTKTIEVTSQGNTSSNSIQLENIPIGNYTVTETAVEGYVVDAATKTANVTKGGKASVTFTNTRKNDNYSVTATKVWDDASNQDGKRPAADEFELTLNGILTGDGHTLSQTETGDTWTYTWSGLEEFDAEGVKINYTVDENTVPTGYTKTVDNTNMKVTNSYTPETVPQITVTKIWSEGPANPTDVRPENVSFKLYAKYTDNGEEKHVKFEGANNTPVVITAEDKSFATVALAYDVTMTQQTATTQAYPKYAFGHELTYYAKEVGTANGELPGKNSAKYTVKENGLSITNTLATAELVINKTATVWTGETTPDSFTFTVNNTAYTATKKSTSENGLTSTYQTAPIVVNIGAPYTIAETGYMIDSTAYTELANVWNTTVDGAVSTSTTKEMVPSGNVVDFTNTRKLTGDAVVATKVWNDANDQDGMRPTSVTLQIKDGDTVLASGTANAANSWKFSAKVPTHSLTGAEYTHTADEAAVPTGYNKTTSGLTVTNTYVPQKRANITVTKVWNDADNPNRPTSVTVQLKQNGNDYRAAVTLNEANNWTYTWTDLQENVEKTAATAATTKALYTVVETVPTGYTATYSSTAANQSSYTITNTINQVTISKTATKTWSNADATHPTIWFALMVGDARATDKDGSVVAIKELQNGTTSVTFDNLNKYAYAADGTASEIVYTVKEVDADGADWTPNGYTKVENGLTVTNTYTGGEKKTITGTKVWVDGENVERKRPASITINLKQNDDVDYNTTTATAENKWTWSFTDLPTYDTNGTAFVYTVSEAAVPGYTTTYSPAAKESNGAVAANDQASYTITNTINTINETANIVVTKNWVDESNYAGLRPQKSAFIVTLTGKVGDTVVTGATRTISGDDWSGTGNTWTKTVTVRKYDDQGNRIEYTAGESDVADYTPEAPVYNGTAGKTSIVPAPDGENLTVAFTNTYNPTKTSVTATKVWNDSENVEGIRPENVTLALYADGVEAKYVYDTAVETKTTAGGQVTWNNLPKYRKGTADTEIVYTVYEMKDGAKVEQNGTIPSLDTGNDRKYTVTYSDDHLTVTNTYDVSVDRVTVKAIKEWEGGVTPDTATIEATLMVSTDNGSTYSAYKTDATKTLTKTDGAFKAQWTELPKYTKVGDVWVINQWKVKETRVPTGWHIKSGEKDGVAATGMANIKTATLTNERDTASLEINKKWITAEGVATPSVQVDVMQNGVLYQVVDLTEAKGWTETLTNVPTHDVNGHAYTYTLKNEAAASEAEADASNLELYTVSYSNGVTLTENGSASLTATNTLNDGTAYHTVTATKTWVNKGVDVEYPSVELQLTSDIGTAGTQAAVTGKVVTVNGSIDEATNGDRESAVEGNVWTATYTNIPKYVEIAGVNTSAARGVINGFRAIIYDVTEGTAPTGYTSDESAQLAVTNTRNLITDNSLTVTKKVNNYTEAMAGDTFTVQIQLPEDIVEDTVIRLSGTTQTTANVQSKDGTKYIEIAGVKHDEKVIVTSVMPTGTYRVTENNANADANNKFEYKFVSVANADLAYTVTNEANEGDLTLKKIVKDSEFVDGTRTFNIDLTASSGMKATALSAWAAEWNKDHTNAVATADGSTLTIAMNVDGTAELEDSYEVTLTSLPNGTYSVAEAEESRADYSVVYSATSAAVNAETPPVVTVTNTRQDNSLSIQVTKNWDIPKYVQEDLGKATLTLERSVDNTEWQSAEELPIEVEDRTNKTHTWVNLEKYDENGRKYTYRVVEAYAHENVKVYNGTEQEIFANKGNKYNQVVTNGTVTFVNKFKLAAMNALTVEKVIADNVANGLDNKANFEITVQRRNPDVAETAENAWVDVTKVTLGNIEPAKLYEVIGEQLAVGTYRACELSVNTDVWTPSYSEDVILNESNRGKLSVTNTRKLLNEDGKLSVTKIWLEANGKNKLTSHIADEKVVVNLYRFSSAEAVTKTPLKMELTEAANWAGIFEKLPATDAAGNPYTYTVKEVDETGAERAEGDKAMFATATAGDLFFEVTIDQENTAKGYTITNKLKDREKDPETTKTADKEEAEIDDVITYTITDVNPYGTTTTATITDTLPNGIAYNEPVSVKIINNGVPTESEYEFVAKDQILTWTIENVPPMSSVKIVFKAKVTEDAVQYDELTNKATISREDGHDSEFKSDEGTVDVDTLVPDLEMIKTLVPEKVAVEPGETITYRLTVKNTGNGRATGVVVTDYLPEQVVAKLDDSQNLTLSEEGTQVIWNVGVVEAGQEVSVEFAVIVKSDEELDELEDRTQIINNAKITEQPPKDPNDPDASDEDEVITPIFRVEIDKTSRVIPAGEYPDADNDPNTASLGDIIEFKVTVKNLGGIAAENIVVEDLMLGKAIDKNIVVSELVEKIMIMLNPEENQLMLPKLEPGKKVEFTYQYKVTEADILAGSVNNVATVTAQNPDSQDDPIVESDETKNQTDPATPSMIFDKAITNDTGKPYGFKKDIAYMLTITNTGNVSLTDAVIVDDMTSGADPEDRIIELEKPILPGETVTVEYTYTVQDGDLRPTYKEDGVTPAEHPIDNKAAVTAMATNDEVISVEDTAHAMAEQWYHIIFVDSRTNEVIEYIDIPYGGRVFEVPEPPYHRGYDFIRWTDWQGENITFNQVVYALYERDTETIFDARIPLAGGYISNVGDCFD